MLHTESPMSIRSGEDNSLDPVAPKMQCLRTRGSDSGEGTVFIPGSSLKGVIRSRCERIVSLLGGECCPVVDRYKACQEIKDRDIPRGASRGDYVYNKMCVACRMFGSTSINSRIRFVDAYPVKECTPVIGMRSGVGINRVTGAAQRGALYDFEVVEEATFQTEIYLKNYELYQLKLLSFALKDLDEGYVSIGGSTSRGNGRMKVQQMGVLFRDYRNKPTRLAGFRGADDVAKELGFTSNSFFYEAKLKMCEDGLNQLLDLLEGIDVSKAVKGSKPYVR